MKNYLNNILLFFVLFKSCIVTQNSESKKLIKEEVYVNLTNYLPAVYSKDGNVDYTEQLQEGLKENNKVLMPDFPILINKNGLELYNNQQVIFQQNSKLIIEPNSETNYALLNIVNKRNIFILNPKLEGDRYKHEGTKGEWGMGISILSSENIIIKNPYITSCWGDGIYIGEDKHTKKTNTNIVIKGGVIDKNRRNGISIITANGLEISDMIICNSNGTNPMCGIDIEPNNNRQFLKNITLKNIRTEDNKIDGIKIYLKYYAGSKNKISIDILNHQDVGSKNGFTYSGVLKEDFEMSQEMKGYINITNFKSENNNEINRTRRTDIPITFTVKK